MGDGRMMMRHKRGRAWTGWAWLKRRSDLTRYRLCFGPPGRRRASVVGANVKALELVITGGVDGFTTQQTSHECSTGSIVVAR